MNRHFLGLDEDEVKILSGVSDTIQSKWFSIYKDSAWVVNEIRKAILYYSVNERKRPKTDRGWAMALTGWLSRSMGFLERDRKKQERNHVSTKIESIEEIENA